MKNSNDYFKQTMDDIVFENRNKNYGAYALRKANNVYILRGLIFVFFAVTAFAVFSLSRKAPVEEIVKILTIKPSDFENFLDPPKPPDAVDPLPPETTSSVAPTVDGRELNPVSDNQAQDIPVTSNDSLADKVISDHTSEGTPGGNINPIESNPGGSGTGTGETTSGVSSNEPTLFPEIFPAFENMNTWLQKNIRYPQIAIDAGAEGKVYVEFVVNTDGSIADAKVVRGIGFRCDEEALRAVKAMPKWKPGMQGGHPVRVRMTVPIQFKLNKN